ncbi:HgcAB-associated protein HgcC [Methanocella sp. MCL-LM]|uniref:HgcAB-associated protein HgcC n=1 Tax=Methanocella sp. MCL-LM TaxID=3412035 RepID=UPI003C76D94C
MVKKLKNSPEPGCCDTPSKPQLQTWKVEALVSVDERGQMVLPKDLRDRAGIKPGDKLAIVSWEKDGAVCCMSLVKADDLAGMVKDMLGPMVKELGPE